MDGQTNTGCYLDEAGSRLCETGVPDASLSSSLAGLVAEHGLSGLSIATCRPVAPHEGLISTGPTYRLFHNVRPDIALVLDEGLVAAVLAVVEVLREADRLTDEQEEQAAGTSFERHRDNLFRLLIDPGVAAAAPALLQGVVTSGRRELALKNLDALRAAAALPAAPSVSWDAPFECAAPAAPAPVTVTVTDSLTPSP